MNKFRIIAVLSVIALLLGMTGCSKEPSINVQELEKSLVGVWWDEYEYKDVTEDGIPFSRVLLAVKADADHTGCIYLGVFDETSDYPLAIYGGPAVAGFTWKLLGNGSLELGVPTTVKSITITRGDGGSYGDTMTDVSGISMTYTGNALTMTLRLTMARWCATKDICTRQRLPCLMAAPPSAFWVRYRRRDTV